MKKRDTRDTVRPRYHSDSTMSSGKKSGTSKPPVASDDDRRKGLRQATMAKDKTSDTLSLVIPPAGGKTAAAPAAITPAAAAGDTPLHLPSPDSLDLQPPPVTHRGEGITDPDLQPTFDDPVHLTFPPDSWEEMQRQEEERKSKRSTPPHSPPSSRVEPGGSNTPKKKLSKKQQKRPGGDLASSDDSSSSTTVEKTDEGSTPSTIRRGAAPPARKMAEMEQKLEQLQAVVNSLSAKVASVVDGQLGLETANNALAASNQDFRTQIATQKARMDSLERTNGELHNQLGDVESQVDNNVRRLNAFSETVNNLQASHDNLRSRMEAFAEQERSRAQGATGGEPVSGSADSCETGIFVSGIQNFMQFFNMDPETDPVVVAGRLMHEIDAYGAINRIFLADRSVSRTTRHQARAVIIYLNSSYHKKQVAVRLKQLLRNHPRLRATVSDVFPATEASRALALNRYAADKRQDQSMTRARVINKNGTAVLQLAEGGSRDYRDTTVSEADLQPFYQARTAEEGGRQVDRRRRDKNEREFRDQERAAGRGGNVTSQPRRAVSPPRRLSTPNSNPIGSQRQPAAVQPVSLPNSLTSQPLLTQQQQRGPPPQPLLLQQQQPGHPPPFQHPAQHNGGQPLGIYNSNSNSAGQQWSQGADGPTVNNAMFSVNPMQHSMQMHPQLMAFLQQQLFGQQQLTQQQQQLYTDNGQQLIMRQDSSNNYSRDGFE